MNNSAAYIILVLLLLLPSLADARSWYFDAVAGSDRNDCSTALLACASPSTRLSAWSAVIAGDTIYLANGATFRETLTVQKSGVSAAHITITAYTPSGRSATKPVITGSNILTNFKPFGSAGRHTYRKTGVTIEPKLVFIDGQFAEKGASATTLNNHEWFWGANVLSIRDNAGMPSAILVEAAQRDTAITFNPHITFIDVSGIEFQHSNSSIVSTANSSDNLTFTDCYFHDYWTGVSILGANNAAPYNRYTISRSRFSNAWGGTFAYHINTAGTAVILAASYCIFERSEHYGIYLGQHRETAFDNCYLTSSKRAGIYKSSAGTDVVRNSIISGNNSETGVGSNYGITGTTGTVTVSYSLVNGPIDTARVTLGAGVILGKDPRINGYNRDALLFYSTDDATWVHANRIGDVFRSVNAAKFTGATAAVQLIPPVSSTSWSQMQAAIDAGDEIASHTRDHWMMTSSAFLTGLKYTGTGSAAVLSIGGNPLSLSVTVTGAADSVSYDLTSMSFNIASKVKAALEQTGKYSVASYSIGAGSPGAADVRNLDIKASAQNLFLDTSRIWSYEVDGSIQDLRNNLLSKDRSGAYNPAVLIYPGGSRSDATDAGLVAHGIFGSRTVKPELRDLRYLPVMKTSGDDPMAFMGAIFKLRFDRSATTDDGRLASGSPFTSSDQAVLFAKASAMEPLREPFNYFVADFRSGNSYVYRTTAFGWAADYTTGSWLCGAYIKPTTLSGNSADEYTIFWHGTDTGNYHRLYLTGDGAAHYEIKTGGRQTVYLFTDTGRFATNTLYSIAVQQSGGVIQLRYGTGFVSNAPADSSATVVTAFTPANYSPHRFQWAAGWNGSAAEKYYQGYMQDAFLATDVERTIIGELETTAAIGSLYGLYNHGRLVTDLARFGVTIMDTYTSASPRLMPLGHALAYLKARGSTLSEDGLYLKTTYTTAPDYRPRSTSPLLAAGTGLEYTTDFKGDAVAAPVTIGPYQNYSDAEGASPAGIGVGSDQANY